MIDEKKILGSIKQALLDLDEQMVLKEINDALDNSVPANDIIGESVAPGLQTIGLKFEKREIYLPELIISGVIVNKAFDLLKPYLLKSENSGEAGKILIGTVSGDVHDIGKNIVSTLLSAAGFDVLDLGIDVPNEEFIRNAIDFKADIVAISALISASVSSAHETILALKDKNIKAKIIVGGAAFTQETADGFGADAYGYDAWDGVEKVKNLLKRRG